MRVAQIVETLDAGGAERLAVDIANELAARGHESHLAVLDARGPFRDRVSAAVRFHDLQHPRLYAPAPARAAHFRTTYRDLAALVRGAGLETVQTHLPKANFLGLFLGRFTDARVHPTVHNNREFDYGDGAGPLRRWLRRRAYRQMLDWCGDMIAVSDQVRLALAAELGLGEAQAARIAVVTNGVALPPEAATEDRLATRRRWGVAPDEVLLVGVGRLTRQKNFASLVAALQAVPEQAPWRCVIAGEGELRGDLEARVAAAGIGDRVALAGHVGDVPGLLSAADVFCLSSLYEGLPLVLLEAMAAALPVCAYAIDGVTDVVADGEQALLAPPEDAAALAEALQRLVADQSLRRRLGEAGRRLVAGEYSFARTVDRLEEIYRE